MQAWQASNAQAGPTGVVAVQCPEHIQEAVAGLQFWAWTRHDTPSDSLALSFPTASQGRLTSLLLMIIFAVQERKASNAQAGPTRVVAVQRPEHIQEARTGLPVLGMEQEIMEAITGNDVCLLCGETGSGKTTQVSLLLTS